MITKNLIVFCVGLVLLALFRDAPAGSALPDASDLKASSYATPARGDVIEWVSPGIPRALRISFDDGSAVLSMQARASLVEVAQKSHPGSDIEVQGRADPQGRLAMAVARSLAIRRALLATGVSPDRVHLQSSSTTNSIDADVSASGATVRWTERSVARTRQVEAAPRVQGHESPIEQGLAASGPSAAPASVAVDVAVAPTSPDGEGHPPRRPTWDVKVQDITIERTLQRWAAAAGYRLQWDAGRNFLVAAPDSYEGTFEAALQSILGSAGIRQSDYPLEACIYGNRPPLVRVTRQGEQARECVSE